MGKSGGKGTAKQGTIQEAKRARASNQAYHNKWRDMQVPLVSGILDIFQEENNDHHDEDFNFDQGPNHGEHVVEDQQAFNFNEDQNHGERVDVVEEQLAFNFYEDQNHEEHVVFEEQLGDATLENIGDRQVEVVVPERNAASETKEVQPSSEAEGDTRPDVHASAVELYAPTASEETNAEV